MSRWGQKGSVNSWGLGKGIQIILFLNLSFFLLQSISQIWFGSDLLSNTLILGGTSLERGQVWRLLSYSVLHYGLWHLFINMLAVFFIGRMLEPALGRRRILFAYGLSVIVGGLAWLGLNWGHPEFLVGASAGVFGLLTLFCLLHPDKPITLLLFFVLPITIRPRVLLMIGIGVEAVLFLFYELPDRTFVASSAHLGGILGGFIALQLFTKAGLLSKGNRASVQARSKPQAAKVAFKVNLREAEALKKEVDRILDKIGKDGFGSLTNKEKETLEFARDLLKK